MITAAMIETARHERPRLASPVATRRSVLKGLGAAAGALVLSTVVDFSRGVPAARAATKDDPPAPNAFVRIGPDDTVTVLIKHLDKGQGIATGLATLVADELDADWATVRAEFAPADAARYNNLLFGPVQGTGGSTSTANSWTQMRLAGAAARAMLVAAAAKAWQVPAGEIVVANGVVSHPSGKSSRFGALASLAAAEAVPAEVTLKTPDRWTLIGTRVPRLDTPGKTTGRTIYSMDVRRPGMLTALIAHPPRFGGTVSKVDATAAKAVPGVVEVIELPVGVAVLAKDTWSAIKGRAALVVEWNDSAAEMRSTGAMFSDYRALADKTGLPALSRGEPGAAMAGAAKVIEAEYSFPYLAHAPMEPLNGVIEIKPDGSAEVWAGAQLQTVEQATVAAVLGLKPEQVTLNTVWAGGSFGRRATPNADYFIELAVLAKATGGKAPIHLVWTREDDLKGGRYRPMFYHRMRAGIGADGKPVAWEHRLVGQSFIIGSPFEAMIVKDGLDGTAVEGASDLPYAIPNVAVSWHRADSPVTTLWWRSVGHTHTAHAVEIMIDELAVAAGKDPVAYRLDLLADHPRHRAVLALAADKAGWGGPAPGKGRGRGVAVHESFGSFVAMVAEVTMKPEGGFSVDRMVAAVDCGIAVNPDVVVAQVEGGIGYALGAALRNQITFTDGIVDQENFDTYEPLRISEMPRVEVHIVPSEAAPSGVGEPGVPPVAPAIANAVYQASGRRLRSLPWDFNAKGA